MFVNGVDGLKISPSSTTFARFVAVLAIETALTFWAAGAPFWRFDGGFVVAAAAAGIAASARFFFHLEAFD